MSLLHLKQEIINAHKGISVNPERAAEVVLSSSERDLINFLSGIPIEHRDAVKENYIHQFRSWISSLGRCLSPHISGRSNFNTKRFEKFNNWESIALKKFEDWKENTLKRFNRKEKLSLEAEFVQTEDLIEKLVDKQDKMKLANKVVKSSKILLEDQEDELINLGFTKRQIKDMLEYKSGIPAYELTNNNGRIKHYQEKLLKLKKRVEARGIEPLERVVNGVRIVENVEIDRLQLFFEGIPIKEMREQMKSQGFKWSPTNKCWQTYLKSGKDKLVYLSLN